MASDLSITIFLSSHILQQVQRICSRVGIMFRGNLVAQGTVAELSKAGNSEAASGWRSEWRATPTPLPIPSGMCRGYSA